MLSGLSFRSAFVFSINSLIFSGFPFHLAQTNLAPRAILKSKKLHFRLPLEVKRCTGVKVELRPHYLLVHGFTFLHVQLSRSITKCFLKKSFFSAHFAINLFYFHNLNY